VAEVEGRVVAFLVTRETAPGEREILNLAVTAEFRRHGIARAMLREVLGTPGDWFLEVRESNAAAIALYRAMGFRVAGARPAYYIQPVEPGIVMRFRS
jgi:ribosomal-protein-alanine N-acetyltransferase